MEIFCEIKNTELFCSNQSIEQCRRHHSGKEKR